MKQMEQSRLFYDLMHLIRIINMRYLHLFTIVGCENDDKSEANSDTASEKSISNVSVGQYNFDKPDAIFELPRPLEEISGISLLDDSTLVAIQDEDGILFLIDTETGKVRNSLKWGKKGDYEDVQVVDDEIWVLRSDGTLFRIEEAETGGIGKVSEIDTPLGSVNDTEGLAYDSVNNRFLIACKESPGKGYSGNVRAIYAFNLDEMELEEKAVFTIDLTEVGGQTKMIGFRINTFKPSAIRLQPSTQDWFVVSSVKKAIVVFSEGELKHIYNLPGIYFEQPEGLEFTSNGSIYVANEGKGGSALLLRFDLQNE